MGTEISGEGSGSPPATSTIIELKKSTVEKQKSKDGSSLRAETPDKNKETGQIEQGKSMGRDISGGDSGSRPVDSRVARRRQDPLGRRLRQMYDEVVSEHVPDDFLSFLEKADERLTSGGDDSGSGSEAPDNKSKS
jgi:hypothetical protein